MEAFEKIRQHPAEQHPAQHPTEQQAEPPTQQAQILGYTEEHKEKFQRRAKKLTLDALSTSCIAKATHNGVCEITVPSETADELIREALGE
jgi:hypothetical protein